MSSDLKFSVGYQLPDQYRFADIVAEFSDHIGEVYFSCKGISSGRGIAIADDGEREEMEEELLEISGHGVDMNMLWNANCHGAEALSLSLEKQVRENISHFNTLVELKVVTTSSLFIASVVKEFFPEIDVRASVNMGIGSTPGMEYVKDYFDSFYVQRELNRYPRKIRGLREWCDANSKKLYLLANSGCLRHCSAHAFHDNIVAHESELRGRENRWSTFQGVCWSYFGDEKNQVGFISNSTWLRPEEIDDYAELVDGVKLATRVHRDPKKVIESYTRRSFDGNTLSLCEPDFSAMRYIDNKCFPNSWIKDLQSFTNEEYENYCQEIYERVKC